MKSASRRSDIINKSRRFCEKWFAMLYESWLRMLSELVATLNLLSWRYVRKLVGATNDMIEVVIRQIFFIT